MPSGTALQNLTRLKTGAYFVIIYDHLLSIAVIYHKVAVLIVLVGNQVLNSNFVVSTTIYTMIIGLLF